MTRCGQYLYNFWRDPRNPRGPWRRTTVAAYLMADPWWEPLLDLDALAGEDWMWGMASLERETGKSRATPVARPQRCGHREFDPGCLGFIADGFRLPEAKGGMNWLDPDTLHWSSPCRASFTVQDAQRPRVVGPLALSFTADQRPWPAPFRTDIQTWPTPISWSRVRTSAVHELDLHHNHLDHKNQGWTASPAGRLAALAGRSSRGRRGSRSTVASWSRHAQGLSGPLEGALRGLCRKDAEKRTGTYDESRTRI